MDQNAYVEIKYESGTAIMIARIPLTSPDAYNVLSYAQSLPSAYRPSGDAEAESPASI